MVNTQLLDEKMRESGYKVGFIVDKLGISRQAFDKKKKNERPFRGAEVYVLCDILNLSDDVKSRIFFADNVERQTTGGVNHE